jgi:hypothetical protein
MNNKPLTWAEIFLFATESIAAVGRNKPPVQLIAMALALDQSGRIMKPMSNLHLRPRLRVHGVIPPFSESF